MTENNSQRAALFQKLGRATTRIEAVTKSKTADLDKYDYSYATLESVMVAVDAACATENLAWVQITDVEGDRWTLDTMLIDIDTGYAHTFSGMPGTIKGDPQAMGSANTYYRRYGLVTLFGIPQFDDDGGKAHRAEATPNARTPAEIEIRQTIGTWPAEERAMFANAFKEQFSSTLTSLPESKHGDALAFLKQFQPTTSGATNE
jgi:hypothetical protein